MGRTQLSPGLRAGFSLSFLAFSTPAPTGWPPSSLLACYSSPCFGEDTQAPLARAGHGHPKLSRGMVGPVLGSSIRKLEMDKDPAQSGLEGLRSLSNDPFPSRGLGWPQVENISLPAHLCRETEQRLSQVLLPSAKSPEGCLPPSPPWGQRGRGRTARVFRSIEEWRVGGTTQIAGLWARRERVSLGAHSSIPACGAGLWGQGHPSLCSFQNSALLQPLRVSWEGGG